MTIPMIGEVDPAAIIALGFLAAVLLVSVTLFVWISAHSDKRKKS